jgi:hypothetical protein
VAYVVAAALTTASVVYAGVEVPDEVVNNTPGALLATAAYWLINNRRRFFPERSTALTRIEPDVYTRLDRIDSELGRLRLAVDEQRQRLRIIENADSL